MSQPLDRNTLLSTAKEQLRKAGITYLMGEFEVRYRLHYNNDLRQYEIRVIVPGSEKYLWSVSRFLEANEDERRTRLQQVLETA